MPRRRFKKFKLMNKNGNTNVTPSRIHHPPYREHFALTLLAPLLMCLAVHLQERSMQTNWASKGRKLHTRTIEVSTSEYDGQRIVVEGFLRDDRFQDSHTITGETFPRGVIHHMVIRLLVNASDFVIEDIDVDLVAVPREVCKETLNCLAPIKGLTIARGFSAKVKKLAGGVKGCTHLLELLTAMTPAAFQGVASLRSQILSGFDADHAKIVSKYLLNTCRAWREDGPFVQKHKDLFNLK
jgi:hypothetical protein